MTEGAIVAVTGGRGYVLQAIDKALLVSLLHYHAPIAELWHGGAVGADAGAAEVAVEFGLSARVFLPEPVLLPEDTQRANLVRNVRMMDELDAAIRHDNRRGFVIAFPGQSGTDHAVAQALRRSIHVVDLRARPYQ